MKKMLMTVLLITLLVSFSFAQTWEVVKQQTNEFGSTDGFFIDANTGWVFGEYNEVWKTENGGLDWTVVRPWDSTTVWWKDIKFFDANVGYACGDKGYIFKTTDGGLNWDMIADTANYTASLKNMAIISADVVYFAGNDWTLLKTTDGGGTYTAQGDSATFIGEDLDAEIDFTDENNGVVLSNGSGGLTWYTHDGGANWNFVPMGSVFPIGTSTTKVYAVAINGSKVVVAGYHYCIFISNDGGETYTFAGNDIDYGYIYFKQISFIDDNTIFVGGGTAGHVMKTTDGGANWDAISVGSGQTMYYMHFVDADNGYVFLYSDQWFKTTDGGASFTPLFDWPGISFFGLALPSDNKIVLTATSGGEMTVSEDGGITWDYPNNFATGADASLFECEFIDENNGLIGGSSGDLCLTTDGGANWTAVENTMSLLTNKHINAIHYWDSDTAFAGGSSGYLMRSVDGGLTWSNTKVNSSTVYDIWPLSGSTVLVSESAGKFCYGVFDASGSVVTDSLVIDVGGNAMRAVEVRNNVVIIPASSGVIFRTTVDELDSLAAVFTDPDGDDLYDVEFVNDTLVFVVGEAGKIYRSDDAGLTWTAEVNPSAETLHKVRFRNGRLWAVGKGGTILMNEIGTPVLPVLAGDYYIPKGVNAQGFESLGEAITCLNGMDVSGTVYFILDADTLREESFTFNADLSAENNVVVKPAPDRDVVLIVAGGASHGNGDQMIGFDKGYITFDGSNNGTASRNLIVTTEQTSVEVPFGLNTSDADTVVIKNLIIKNLDNGVSNFKYGAVTNDVAGIEGFTVENCQIGSAEFPVYRDGVAVWGSGSGPTQGIVLNNEIYAGCRGIATYVVNDCIFSGNTIHMLPTTSATTYSYVHGIYLTGASGPTVIHDNTINCLEAATVSDTYVIGIAFAGNSEGEGEIISVVNNMINAGAAAGTHATYGIGLRSANPMGNIQAYHNTIVINEHASTLTSYAVGSHTKGTGPVDIDLKNNIIVNNHTGNTASAAIGLVPTTSVLISDYNVLVSDQNFVNYQGTSYTDLVAWQAAGQDANSVSKAVEFVSATDLHLAGASIGDIDLAGMPLETVTTDIDGDARSTTHPYKGADESDEIQVSIDINTETLPVVYKLHQNYPNPFNPTTTISFDLPEAANVNLVVYNMMGQQVAELKNENMQPGFYKMNFNASHLASGVYLYRIQANNFTSLKKMTILK